MMMVWSTATTARIVRVSSTPRRTLEMVDLTIPIVTARRALQSLSVATELMTTATD